MNCTLLGPLSLIKASNELFCGGPANVHTAMLQLLFNTKTEGWSDTNTWEESVNCQHEDINPS